MAKFNEMSVAAQIGVLFLIAVLIGGGIYYIQMKPVMESSKQLQQQLADKQAENARLKQFEAKLADLNQEMLIVQKQLELAKKIVPDDKDADQFIKLLHDQAAGAGVEIRRYEALPVASKGFYSEIPFQLDLDGPYYSVMTFFDKVSKMERIINIGNLQMSNTKATGPAKVKGSYTWAPGESVVASCTATTFFSHELQPAPATEAAKK
jgi:type IV pilus assembly protein PilO